LVKDVQIKVINALNTLITIFPDCIITDLVYDLQFPSNDPTIKINFSNDNLHLNCTDIIKSKEVDNTFNFLLSLVVSLPLSLIVLNQFYLSIN
jgi:hypothetical protein